MRRATPQISDFARRLMAFEANEKKSSGTGTQAAFHVCEKVRPYLATLMGKAGFGALLSHALALAKQEVPGLHAVHVSASGSLEGLDEYAAHGGLAIVAQLLGLLVVFIGEGLTVRLMREVWPEVTVNVPDFSKEIK